jgi:photosystem II stability/assembly factor-like uncharacterized protein
MARFCLLISLFIAVPLAAQNQIESINQEFGGRHAKNPQNPSDTGILFDEYRLEKAAGDYWNTARFSEDNIGKTMRQIETDSYNAIRNMENQVAFKSLSNPAWQPIGGSQDGHASGRVRGIAFDPTDSKIVYIAAASGGIWKTMNINDQPVQWINLSDRLPTMNFGSIAVDPKRSNVVYAGTGESQGDMYREQISSSAPAGTGIYKSTDGGFNWILVDTSVGVPAAEGNVCSQIVIDPINTDTIYIATGNNYIIKSVDGGMNWTKISVGVATLSIAIDPINTNNLYVSGFGSIYRSTNYGTTWTKCVTGLPTSSVGRISVAIAPSDPRMIYASIGTNTSGIYEGVAQTVHTSLGIWLSSDYGISWSKMMQFDAKTIDADKSPLGNQQEWCNTIAVHPTNPKRIFVAGLNVFSSNDSGKTLTQISNWRNSKTSSGFVHADIHLLLFNGTTLYACTDGGIAKTQNYTLWNTTINQGLATLQFVGVDADKEFTYVTGGCQDNSTNRASITSTEFHETIGGDGGHAWVSQEQGNIAYTTYVYTNFKQSLDGGQSWPNGNLIHDGSPLANEGSPFYTVYDCSADGSVVALGGNRHVWISTSGGIDGFPNQSNVTISNSYAIHVSQQDPTFMWAGSGSNIYRTTDQGATWVKPTTALSSTITGITSNPNNTTDVYACATGGKHFFKSTDGGITYTSPATNLPNVPCWSIAFNQKDGKIFLGTEKGVLFSDDGGVTWYPLMGGMAYAMVTQLRVRGLNNDKLLAGTYGRGMFWLDISNLAGVNSSDRISTLSLDPVNPNPMTSDNATIGFSLKDPGVTTITLHDALGREVRILDKTYYDAGKHRISFAKQNIISGIYFIMLTENGKSVSQKIIVE